MQTFDTEYLVTRNRRKGTIRKTMWYGLCLFWIAFLVYMIISAYEGFLKEMLLPL